MNIKENVMSYTLRKVTAEDRDKVRSNYGFSESPSKMLNLLHLPSGMWVIDDEKGFYFFQVPTDMRSGYGSYAFFFRNLTYGVRVYHWSGSQEPQFGWVKNGISNSQQIVRGFTCFERFSSLPPNNIMEEFQREFIEAFLQFWSDEVTPVISDPAVVHRIISEEGVA